MTRREWLVVSGLFLGLSVLSFAPVLRPGVMLFGTDSLAGSFAFYEAVAAQLRSGELPRWMPHVYGGVPLFANAGSSFHPVHLVASLLLPTSVALIVVLVVQFALAGLGMHVLARELGARPAVAVLAGLAFQFTGLARSWIYAGHDGRIIALTLSPLVLVFVMRAARSGAARDLAGLGATLGLALLGNQLQVAWYLLVLASGWGVFWLVREPGARLARARALIFGGGLAFGLAAINLLPFSTYVSASARGGTGPSYDFGTSFSATPRDLAGLALPELSGSSVHPPGREERPFPAYEGANRFKLHTEYVGALALLGVLLALGAWREALVRFFLGAAALFTVLALGGNTPLYPLLWRALPGLHRFRAPDLAVSMLSVSLVVLLALGLEAWLRSPRRAVLASAAGLLLAATVAAALVAGHAGAALRFGVPLLATAGLLALTPRLPRASWAALGLVTVLDLGNVARHFVHAIPPVDQVLPRDGVIAFLEKRAQPERAWVLPTTPAWRGGGNLLMRFGLRQLGGEHPLPSKRWLEWVGLGPSTMADWHHVFARPELTPAGLAFDAAPVFLAAANVRHVVSPAPLAVPWLREVYRDSSGVVSELDAALPQAWLVGEAKVVADGAGSLAAVEDPAWDPRRTAFVESGGELWLGDASPVVGAAIVQRHGGSLVTVRTLADRRALLVVADAWHDGWRAWVDGQPVPVFATNHAFRGVPVPAGSHEVVLRFEPPALWSGLIVSLVSLALLLALASLRMGGAMRG
jgi:hypothetical protein